MNFLHPTRSTLVLLLLAIVLLGSFLTPILTPALSSANGDSSMAVNWSSRSSILGSGVNWSSYRSSLQADPLAVNWSSRMGRRGA